MPRVCHVFASAVDAGGHPCGFGDVHWRIFLRGGGFVEVRRCRGELPNFFLGFMTARVFSWGWVDLHRSRSNFHRALLGVVQGVCWWMSLTLPRSFWCLLSGWGGCGRFSCFVGRTGNPDLNVLFLKVLSFDSRLSIIDCYQVVFFNF